MKFTCEMFHPNSTLFFDTFDFTRKTFPIWNSVPLISVFADGRVCISILHAPGDDPMGYELSAERWSPVQSVEKILLSVVSMLAGKLHSEHSISFDYSSTTSGCQLLSIFSFCLTRISEPNDESGANVDAAIMWRDKREQFNKVAKSIVRKTLGLPS